METVGGVESRVKKIALELLLVSIPSLAETVKL